MSDPLSGAEIARRLDELGRISDADAGLTRLYLSPAHRRAVDLVAGWMREAGMETRLDALASLIGRYEGDRPGLPALVIGSHIDSVRNAGRFDGPLGVLTGIAAVAALHRAGRRLPFAIEVAAFGDEEGVRFPSTLGGSRAFAGTFDPNALDERDREGVSRREALLAFGCDPEGWPACRLPPDTLGYLEVHIEQGPVLEAKGLALGVVTAIAGATRGTVTVTGMAGHAGTVPMPLRQDALCAAAEMALAIEAIGRSEPGLVATIGQIEIPGGAINTVPGRCRFTLDIRSAEDAHRKQAVARIEKAIQEIAASRSVGIEIALGFEERAATCDPRLRALLSGAMTRCGHAGFALPSGAGHDGMAFRDVLPFAMLFVRCKGGVSHNPAEFATPPDIEAGARVLAEAIEELARQRG